MRFKIFGLSAIVLLLFTGASIWAQQPAHYLVEEPKPAAIMTNYSPAHEKNSSIQFIANKNQWEKHIIYASDIPGGKLFFEKNTLTYNFANLKGFHDLYFHREDRNAPYTIDFHAIKVNLLGSNPNPEISPSEKSETYHNYFLGNDPAKWAGQVPLYQKLDYLEIYDQINLAFYCKENSLKYDFIIAPGGDPSKIKLAYEGVDDMFLKEGKLHLKLSFNEIIEDAPYAYQQVNGEEVEISCEFSLENNVISFTFPEGYNNELPLIIDPTLIFSSFTGSNSDNFGYTATYDDNGNLYAGGIAFGVGYPITTGAYQTTFGGGGGGGAFSPIDISISKFNPTGTALVYSTFLGGSNNEQPHSLITNANGELFVYGRTYSVNYPTTSSAYDNIFNGRADIIVTRFNAAGSALLGSTYVGGAGEDGTNINTGFMNNSLKYNYGDDARGEIMLDEQGNVYIASCTQSNNFPTASPFQATFGGGTQDGVVFKLSPNLSNMVWGSYIGGSGNDAAYSIKVDTNNIAYVCGGTESADFPTIIGSHQTLYGGAIDGFVAKINTSGNALLASSYIGTSNYDQAYFLELGNDFSVYLYGQSLGPFPITPGKYGNLNGKQFVAKLQNDLSTIDWSTVFGSGSFDINISPTAFLVDICGFIYMAGWGGTTNFQGTAQGMPTTPNALYPTAPNGSDLYLIVLEPEAVGLEYATYFGGATSAEHVDGGTSRFNKNLEVYHAVCAGCGGNSDFPSTPGAVSATNNSSNCNLAAFKIQLDAQSVEADFAAVAFSGCAPFPVDFTNTSTGGVSFVWDFGDGSFSNQQNPSHTYTQPGTYPVKLLVIDSNSCNVVDSIIQNVTVFSVPVATSSGGGTVCEGAGIQLTAGGGQFYQWTPTTGLSNPNAPNPIASPSTTTTYQVIVSDSGGCSDTADVTVTVTNFSLSMGPAVSFCEGTGGVQLQAGGIGSNNLPFYYEWSCDTALTYCGLDSVFDDDPIANPTVSTWYYLQVTDGTGCKSEVDSIFVEVLPNPIVDAGPDIYICGDSAPGDFLNGSICCAPAPYTYYWNTSTGLNDSTVLNPFARPDTTTIYTLIAISANGCASQVTTVDSLSSVTVHVNPVPVAEAGPDKDICFGDTIMLQGYGTDAGPQYEFEWSPYVNMTDSNQPNPLVSPTLTTDYILTVWSNNCPSYGDTVTITVHTLPTVDAGSNREICLFDSILLDASASGDSSSSGYAFSWFPGKGLNNNLIEDPLASPDSSTWYYVQATSSWGCKSPVDSVLLSLKPTPIANAGSDFTLCYGDTGILQGGYFYTTTDSAPDNQIYYSWAPGINLNDTTVAQPFVKPLESSWYYLTVIHNTCQTMDSVLVNVIPALNLVAQSDTNIICEGDSVQLTAQGGLGGANFIWFPEAGLSNSGISSPMAAPDTSTIYTVIIEEGGCYDSLTIPVEVIPGPKVDYVTSNPRGCVNFEVNFLDLSEEVIHYIWEFGDGSPVSNEVNPTHTYTAPGTYTVSLTGVNRGGCKSKNSNFQIEVYPKPALEFNSNPPLPAEVYLPGAWIQLENYSQNATHWFWQFGDGQTSEFLAPKHRYNKPGEYWITLVASNGHGCQNTLTRGPLIVKLPELFIPNVFTPNADGQQDFFIVQYKGSQPIQVKILDRWGNEVFTSGSEKRQYWDGKDPSGVELPEGVYYYIVTVGEKEYTGSLTLMR